MPSVAYQLMSASFDTLSPSGWHRALKNGDLRLSDPNEEGPQGSFLWMVLSKRKEKLDYQKQELNFPDTEYEGLLLGLVEAGANPWIPCDNDPLAVWKAALIRGLPRFMACLVNHPLAPSREKLESVLLNEGSFSKSQRNPPAQFARWNQADALKGWADLGFNVNLGVGEGKSAGREARSPAFLRAWVESGGAVTSDDTPGVSLPSAWKFTAATQKIAMEREWYRHQKAAVIPVDQAMETYLGLLRERMDFTKGEAVFRLKALGLSLKSVDSQGRTIASRWLPWFLENPRWPDASVAGFLLQELPIGDQEKALIAALLAQKTTYGQRKYPNDAQFSSFWSSMKPALRAAAFHRVASATRESPFGFAKVLYAVVPWMKERIQEKLLSSDESSFSSGQGDSIKSREMAAEFWAPWFAQTNPRDGGAQGWLAFAHWSALQTQNTGSSLHLPLWKSIFEKLDGETLHSGRDVLRLAYLRSAIAHNADADLQGAWGAENTAPWPSAPLSENEGPMSKAALNACTILEQSIDTLVQANGSKAQARWTRFKAFLLERRLENVLEESPTPSAHRPRF